VRLLADVPDADDDPQVSDDRVRGPAPVADGVGQAGADVSMGLRERMGRPQPWARSVTVVASAVLTTRLVVLVSMVLSTATLPLSPNSPIGKAVAGFIGAMTRWDANHYVTIARYGYQPGSEEIAFSPLYPMTIRAVHTLVAWWPSTQEGYRLAAVLVANAAMIVAAALLYAVARDEWGRRPAERSIWLFLAFPTALFLSVGYSESLYLSLTLGTALCLRRQHWLAAGGLGALAALSRPQGVLVVVLIAAEAWAQRRTLVDMVGRLRVLAALGLPALAMVGWMAWQGLVLGDALAFAHVQSEWARGLTLPWDTFIRFASGPISVHSGLHSLVDLAFTIFAVVMVALVWRWSHRSYAWYGSALLLAPLLTGTLLSMPRFVLGIFPIFTLLGRLTARPRVERVVLTLSVGGLALASAWYAQYYWVA
jgi:hypothetical protein